MLSQAAYFSREERDRRPNADANDQPIDREAYTDVRAIWIVLHYGPQARV